MSQYSYHIFYFPFKWEIPCVNQRLFSEQVDLASIPIQPHSMWERVQSDNNDIHHALSPKEIREAEELFGEQQYFFEFVHPVLYDSKSISSSIIHHYERREPKQKAVEYNITVKDRVYILKLDAINLNLYSTGVGVLSFYMANEREDQKDETSVRAINQFGRRIMPPHSGEFNKDMRSMIAQNISISGLNGENLRYSDSFDYNISDQGKRGLQHIWEPARFICNLIDDLSPELKATAVVDDRMLVNCWYANNDLSKLAAEKGSDENSSFISGDFWYKYVFVDEGKDETCQNDNMKKELLKDSTYFRWQKYGTLYGVSRYSLVALINESDWAKNVLGMHMRTIYSRMFELVIIQRASILRFSGEVTKVSGQIGYGNKENAQYIGSLYKEYIRFVNQIYFRNITAQDQGIEIYDMMLKQFESEQHIKGLDDEIEELNQYITLLIDQKRNENGEWLNWLAAAVLPATLLAGLFGMNRFKDLESQGDFWGHVAFIIMSSVIVYLIINKKRK